MIKWRISPRLSKEDDVELELAAIHKKPSFETLLEKSIKNSSETPSTPIGISSQKKCAPEFFSRISRILASSSPEQELTKLD